MNNRQPAAAVPRFSPGQRWLSSSEPELGLGIILSFANRRIEIAFKTHETTRTLAIETAPLQRIIFAPGNTIEDTHGNRHTVVSVTDEPVNHLVSYQCTNATLREDELSDTLSFSTPEQRLMAGIADNNAQFSLRYELLRQHASIAASPLRGYSGARIDPLPHQFSIVQKTVAQSVVRVLLADETGLGKTIEACLILHRMLCTGQVSRALILVPDALVHQWFVELLRRFNLLFRLITDDAVDEEDMSSQFDEDPLWICSTTLLRRYPVLTDQLAAVSWDLLIVDEAHHITGKDALFGLLSALSAATPSVILLSATPEQFGRKGHFERLRLLDPHRYREMEDPGQEAQRLQLISSCIGKQIKTLEGEVTSDTQIRLSPKLYKYLVERQHRSGGSRESQVPDTLSIAHLIDLFGAGRAYFRNTRKTIAGFPKRTATMYPLTPAGTSTTDPHADWIAQFCKQYPRRKVLVITSTIESATVIRDDIQKQVAIDIALFHESMTLIQRDRQAAWFAEDHGARVLVCSESGSEGRNFQFCSDLVLLNVPWNPELLEQRIGRLDRIGQKHAILIHLPVIAGSENELLCRWYHEGIDAFEKNVPAAAVLFESMESRLQEIIRLRTGAPDEALATFADLIAETQKRVTELSAELFSHRDYLLEFASNSPHQVQPLITALISKSTDNDVADIMLKLFAHYGIKLEEAGNNRFALITEFCTDHSFPLPRSERPVITYDRATACTYDTIEFLTIDHPMVTGALDLFLSSPLGSSSFALWNDMTTNELLLESLYILECIAPPALRLFRFFTPYPVRIVVNHLEELVTDRCPPALLKMNCKNGPVARLLTQKQLINVTFPKLLACSNAFSKEHCAPLIAGATEKMRASYAEERSRLLYLRAQGAPVTDVELARLDSEEKSLAACIAGMRIRHDAIRLIWRGTVRG